MRRQRLHQRWKNSASEAQCRAVKGCWRLGDEHVEPNETLKDALKREFKEEANLNVGFSGIIDERVEKTFGRMKIIVAFDMVSAQGGIKLNSEYEAYGWLARAFLVEYAMFCSSFFSPSAN